MNKFTYISLFSSAGVGCYGFKEAGFECIATNEILEKRLNIQKINNKCKYNSGYILGSIEEEDIKLKLLREVNFWRKKEKIKEVDVIIATPPCQGMSVANHKKKENEIERNSLVIESLIVTKKIKPKVFVFENVPSFLNTVCQDVDGVFKSIEDAIKVNLSKDYNIDSKVINFKDYGANSSRKRTIVIGVNKKYESEIIPLDLFPREENPKTLYEVIGHLPRLKEMGYISGDDIYHGFRKYKENMRCWISDIKQGQSAFDNTDPLKIPHKIVNGQIVYNANKNKDKYTRQIWNKVAPCIHTRNDTLSSQNTVHPEDDRVFSIRELMLMMNIPDSFKWIDNNNINNLTLQEKHQLLKDNEVTIRRSIGEAVPTIIFNKIACNIKELFLNIKEYSDSSIKNIIKNSKLYDTNSVIRFINNNDIKKINIEMLSKIAELTNSNRLDNAAFYTDKENIFEIINNLPDFNEKNEIKILEPSVGVGNFIFPLIKKYRDKEKVEINVVDIDSNSINIFKALIKKLDGIEKDIRISEDIIYISNNIVIKTICEDFLTLDINERYDLVIGNPPYGEIKDKNLIKKYSTMIKSVGTKNIFALFLKKSMSIADYVSLVIPKALLSSPEYKLIRDNISTYHIKCIIDFGEKGFKGVKIETISLNISTSNIYKNNKQSLKWETKVISKITNSEFTQLQSKISSEKFPTWLLYRNQWFDSIVNKLELGVFNSFRDRQITNKMLEKRNNIEILKISSEIEELTPHYYGAYKNVSKSIEYQFLNIVKKYDLKYDLTIKFLMDNCIVNNIYEISISNKDEIYLLRGILGYLLSTDFIYNYKIFKQYRNCKNSIIVTKKLRKLENKVKNNRFPIWLLYSSELFNNIVNRLRLDCLAENSNIEHKIVENEKRVRVLKSRNIGNNEILDISNYDCYIDIEKFNNLSILKYLSKDNIVMVPNLTYNPRATFLPNNCIVNGSVALLTIKDNSIELTKKMLEYFSTKEFSDYYKIARNYGTRSLNIDSNSVFYFGILKNEIIYLDKDKVTENKTKENSTIEQISFF